MHNKWMAVSVFSSYFCLTLRVRRDCEYVTARRGRKMQNAKSVLAATLPTSDRYTCICKRHRSVSSGLHYHDGGISQVLITLVCTAAGVPSILKAPIYLSFDDSAEKEMKKTTTATAKYRQVGVNDEVKLCVLETRLFG